MAIIRHRQGYVDIFPNPPKLDLTPPYEHDQTVEVDPREPLPQHGNVNRVNMKTIYDAWNAAYRGLTPHQINPLPITPRAATAVAPNQFGDGKDDNPKPFTEPTPETRAEGEQSEDYHEDRPDVIGDENYVVPVSVVDDTTISENFFHVYRVNVGATTPQMIVAQQRYRDSVTLVNLGNQTVWIAETESRLTDGWPMYSAGAGATPSPYPVPTAREIWAVADPAAGANLMSVAVMITYERKMLQ